jgi:hypothetical protein
MVNKESLEELRLQAIQNIGSYQEETQRWKNKQVKHRSIASGDVVLKKRIENKSR